MTLLVSLLALPFGALAPAAAHASAGSDEARFLSLTNQLRASVGVPGLSLDASMSNVARSWAQQMAANGTIAHNPSRGSQITGWSVLGENVGMGSSVDVVHEALVNSHAHYENLVSSEFTLVGIGVAYGPNTIYVAQEFMAPAGGGSHQIESAPEPEPTTAPVEESSTTSVPAARPSASTTAAPATTSTTAAPEAPAATPAPDPVPNELRPVLEQLREWTAIFFPGADASVALPRGASSAGDGG
ncbi:MAG TPA: CAP domain-containing protein [Acidimicrobiales bacterium]|nr:CAP domain-containing protein [Acidimicrobiales bacterium]